MKMDLPKRRSQQKRSRNLWRWLSFLFGLILLVTAGLFWAHRHQSSITHAVNGYTHQYRDQVSQWAEQKQARLKTEIGRFKPKHEPVTDDVHFQFYSELSRADVNVQEDEITKTKEVPPPKNNKSLALEDAFNPDKLTTEFENSLSTD